MANNTIEQIAKEQATKDFLGNQGKPPAYGFGEQPPLPPPIIQRAQEYAAGQPSFDAGQFVRQGFLPTVGAALGSPAGLPGMMVGSGLGELGNQLIGNSDQSSVTDTAPHIDPTAIGMATAAPGVGNVAGKAINGVVRNAPRILPGAGTAIHEAGAEMAQALPGAVAPPRTVPTLAQFVGEANPRANTQMVQGLLLQHGNIPPGKKVSDVLYDLTDAVNQANPVVIPSTNTSRAILKLSNTEGAMGKDTKSPRIANILDEWSSTLKTYDNRVPFGILRERLRRINDRIASTEGEEQGAYKLLKKSIMQDMDAAGTAANQDLPAAQIFRAANLARTREAGADALKELVKGAINERGSDQLISFNRGHILKGLKDDDLQRTLGPDGVKFVRDELSHIGILPALPPPPGSHVGSSRTLLSGALGTLAGSSGGPMGMAAGAAAGPLIAEVLGRATQTELGRQLIRKLAVAGGGNLNPQSLSILAAFVHGGLGGDN